MQAYEQVVGGQAWAQVVPEVGRAQCLGVLVDMGDGLGQGSLFYLRVGFLVEKG